MQQQQYIDTRMKVPELVPICLYPPIPVISLANVNALAKVN